MGKYINGGVIESFVLFYYDEKDIPDIFSSLADKIDLDLFEVKKSGNAYYFDLKKEVLEKNFVKFLKEIRLKNLTLLDSMDENIKILEKREKKDFSNMLEECDDIFKDHFTFADDHSLCISNCDIEVQYIAFYFDGPFTGGYYGNLVNYLFWLLRGSLTNSLKNALCFGVN